MHDHHRYFLLVHRQVVVARTRHKQGTGGVLYRVEVRNALRQISSRVLLHCSSGTEELNSARNCETVPRGETMTVGVCMTNLQVLLKFFACAHIMLPWPTHLHMWCSPCRVRTPGACICFSSIVIIYHWLADTVSERDVYLITHV